MNVHFLGTGSGLGIPVIGCECKHCEIARKMGGKFERKRTAILLEDNNTKILIEASPDIYSEIRDFEMDEINILVSHCHIDHCAGIVEFKNSPDPVNFYVEKSVLYLMQKNKIMHDEIIKRKFNIVKLNPFEKFKIGKIEAFYFPVPHTTQTFGIYFNVNNKKVIYSSDMKYIETFPKSSLEVFRNADLVIINTPTFEPKYDHMTIVEALEFVKRTKIKKAILTHISHRNMPHDKLCEFVMKNNKNVIISYDGMKIKI